MYALKFLLGVAAIATGGYAADIVDQPLPAPEPAAQIVDEPIHQGGYAAEVSYRASQSCFVDVERADDGLLVSAWTDPGYGGVYRMVVTQRYGASGFDIVQEGDVPAGAGGNVLLSDVWLDVEADFVVRLSTWTNDGELLCTWGDRR